MSTSIVLISLGGILYRAIRRPLFDSRGPLDKNPLNEVKTGV